jgi:hypothetical protein
MDWSDYEVDGQLSIEDIVLETWRDVVGYEGYYQVSNTGKVKSISRNIWNGKGYIKSSGKLLKQGTNQKGYPIVYLSKNSKSKTITVHRLVAKAFIENPSDKPQVNHIDGNKKNNNVSNLEWCSNQENQLHAVINKLNDHSTYKSGKAERPVYKIDTETNEVIAKYNSISEATDAIGYKSKSNIGACCRGLKKTVGGYKWVYADERQVM